MKKSEKVLNIDIMADQNVPAKLSHKLLKRYGNCKLSELPRVQTKNNGEAEYRK